MKKWRHRVMIYVEQETFGPDKPMSESAIKKLVQQKLDFDKSTPQFTTRVVDCITEKVKEDSKS